MVLCTAGGEQGGIKGEFGQINPHNVHCKPPQVTKPKTMRVQGQPCRCVLAACRRTILLSLGEHAEWRLPPYLSHGLVDKRGFHGIERASTRYHTRQPRHCKPKGLSFPPADRLPPLTQGLPRHHTRRGRQTLCCHAWSQPLFSR